MFAFSKNRIQTMYPIDGRGNFRSDMEIGQRKKLSDGDVTAITTLYLAQLAATNI